MMRRGQRDGHHAGAQVNVAALLILRPAPRRTDAVRATWQMHSPTVMVKAGLTEEARTMSGAVAGGADGQAQAGLEEPRQQQRHSKHNDRRDEQLRPSRQRAAQHAGERALGSREKIVSHLNTLRVEEKPIAIRLMV